MTVCSRCGRYHNPPCGIPRIGVRLGMGARPIRTSGESFPIGGKPGKPSKAGKDTLEHLLRWGEGEVFRDD